MTQQDPTDKSKAQSQRFDASESRPSRGDDKQRSNSSSESTVRPSQASRTDKPAPGSPSLPRYDDRPSARPDGDQEDDGHREPSTPSRSNKPGATPNYGDREPGDPRHTDIEAGAQQGVRDPGAAAGQSNPITAPQGARQPPGRSASGQAPNPGSQRKTQSDSTSC